MQKLLSSSCFRAPDGRTSRLVGHAERLEWNLAWVEAPESQMCVLLRRPWLWAEAVRALVVSSWNRHVCEDPFLNTPVVEQSRVC